MLIFSDAASSSSSEQAVSTMDDEDDMEVLQYSQLSVEEMCVILMAHVLEFLHGQLSSNLQVVTSTLELLFHVVDLIKTVAPDDLWVEGSQANAVMVWDTFIIIIAIHGILSSFFACECIY